MFTWIIYNIKNTVIKTYLKAIKWFYKDTGLKKVQINGHDLYVNPSTEIGSQIFGLRKYEYEITQFLEGLIGKEWTCVDVGANIGYYTLLLSGLAYQGRVHAFEPVGGAYEIADINIFTNDRNNITNNNFALSNKNGKELLRQASDDAFSSFRDTKQKPIITRHWVFAIMLDRYIWGHRIGKVDFVKIDVEGAEKMVLEGARKMLREMKPILLVELGPGNLKVFGITGADIIRFLAQYGYKPFELIAGTLRPTNRESGNMFFIYKDLRRKRC